MNIFLHSYDYAKLFWTCTLYYIFCRYNPVRALSYSVLPELSHSTSEPDKYHMSHCFHYEYAYVRASLSVSERFCHKYCKEYPIIVKNII